MNLTNWLKGLSEAFQHKQTPLEQFEYLSELKTWTLSDEHWLELKAFAKRQYTFFPKVAELELLSHEVRRQVASARGSSPAFETWIGDDGKWYARRRTG